LCGRSPLQHVINGLTRKTGLRSDLRNRHPGGARRPDEVVQIPGCLAAILVRFRAAFRGFADLPKGAIPLAGDLGHWSAASLTRAWNMERCPERRWLCRQAYSSR